MVGMKRRSSFGRSGGAASCRSDCLKKTDNHGFHGWYGFGDTVSLGGSDSSALSVVQDFWKWAPSQVPAIQFPKFPKLEKASHFVPIFIFGAGCEACSAPRAASCRQPHSGGKPPAVNVRCAAAPAGAPGISAENVAYRPEIPGPWSKVDSACAKTLQICPKSPESRAIRRSSFATPHSRSSPKTLALSLVWVED